MRIGWTKSSTSENGESLRSSWPLDPGCDRPDLVNAFVVEGHFNAKDVVKILTQPEGTTGIEDSIRCLQRSRS